ncbi:protein of unknown function [Streptomyces sp. KY70]|nr:protein of unknown function [Streptomyces sp. KY70]
MVRVWGMPRQQTQVIHELWES